jgi:O-antigen ligase
MRDTTLRRYVEALVPLSTLLLAFMPIVGMKAMVFIALFWLLVLGSRAALDPSPIETNAWRWTLFLALPLLITIPDAIRAPDALSGWQFIERSSSFLVFPVGFLLLGGPSSDRFREAMMDLLTISALLLAAYGNSKMVLYGIGPRLVGDDFSMAYRSTFAWYTGIHPPYASYFFLSGAVFQLERVLDRARRPVLRLLAVVLLVLASLLIASRMPLIAFAGAAAAVIFMRLPAPKAISRAAIIFVVLLVLAALTPSFRERMAEVFSLAQERSPKVSMNSMDIRVPIAHCSLSLIEEHWLVGIGQANVQHALNGCYQQFNIPRLQDGSFGSHNQLLHWWLSFGLPGVLLYVTFFGAMLIRAWQRRDAAHMGFLVLLMLCSATENLLTRQWGVMLFTCFNALFVAAVVPVQGGGRRRPAA